MKRYTCIIHGEEFDLKCSQCHTDRDGEKRPQPPTAPESKEEERELCLV